MDHGPRDLAASGDDALVEHDDVDRHADVAQCAPKSHRLVDPASDVDLDDQEVEVAVGRVIPAGGRPERNHAGRFAGCGKQDPPGALDQILAAGHRRRPRRTGLPTPGPTSNLR
jgi:hypothetical protein